MPLTLKFTDRGDIMRVYIKTDSENRITAVNSEIFISDVSGWTEIDSGDGDRFAHAQGNYLPKPITDNNGVYRYKFENGKISERSADEMAADISIPTPAPTDHERLEALETMFSEMGALSLLGGIKMSRFYVFQIKLGRISIDDVPLRWREAVRKEIENNE